MKIDTPESDPAEDNGNSADQIFLATASHEIRTPLNGILGTVSLLLETELKPAQREYVEAIQLSGSRLLDMLNNVLDYARLDAGEVELEETWFCPASLATEVVELLAPRAHTANIDVAVCNRIDTPLDIFADDGRIRQILFNLIGNALKFTQTGGVLINVETGDDEVRWTIIDTGPGIGTEDQAALFDAFRQTSAGDAQKDGGVGLGLAIVRKLTGMLGGTVQVQSTPGLGAAFTLSLPTKLKARPSAPPFEDLPARVTLVGLPEPTVLSVSEMMRQANVQTYLANKDSLPSDPGVILAGAILPSDTIASLGATAPTLVVFRPEDRSMIARFRLLGCAGWLVRPLRRASLLERISLANSGNRNLGEEKRRSELSGAHVLIADDNAVNTLIAKRALEKAGWVVNVAATGVEALEMANKIDHALILMDLRMPIMDGFEAMKRLRTEGHNTPIIAVSAEINPSIEEEARRSGANAVAAKPLDAAMLRRLAENWAQLPISKVAPPPHEKGVA